MLQTRFVLIIFSCLVFAGCTRRTILIDDVVQSEAVLEKLDTAAIFSYNEWRRGKAPEFYQRWNKKTTLVVIRTKVAERKLQAERYDLLNRLLDSAEQGASVLFVSDGFIIPAAAQLQLRQLRPDTLSAAIIMDATIAQSLYGSKARPITVVINTCQASRQLRSIK